VTAPNKTTCCVFSFRAPGVNKSMSVSSPCRHLLCVLLLGAILTGCSKPASQSAPPPPVVSVVQPVAREVVEWDEYIGRLEAPETVEIRARVSGYLDKVHFKEGKPVKKGDLLFTIDPRPYQAEFDRADGEYQRTQSQAELAKNDFERAKRLILTKAISDEDLDTKAKNYTTVMAAMRSAKAAADLAILKPSTAVVEHVFEAGHVWDPSFIIRAGEFVDELLS